MRFAFTAVVALAGTAFALPIAEDKRSLFGPLILQGDLVALAGKLKGVRDGVAGFNGDKGAFPALQAQADDLYATLEKTASDANKNGKLDPLSTAFGFGEIKAAAPTILDAIAQTISKKPQFDSAGVTSQVADDIVKLHGGLDDFADALLNIADQSVVSEGTALKAQVDAAFESAEKAYGK